MSTIAEVKQKIRDTFIANGATAPDVYLYESVFGNRVTPARKYTVVIDEGDVTTELEDAISLFSLDDLMIKAELGRMSFTDTNSPLDKYQYLLTADYACGV